MKSTFADELPIKMEHENAKNLVEYLQFFKKGFDPITIFLKKANNRIVKKKSDICKECNKKTCTYLCRNHQIF